MPVSRLSYSRQSIPNRLDQALACYVDEVGACPEPKPGAPGYVRDLRDLVPPSKPSPHMLYFGSLFIFPRSLALSTRKSLAVRVEFRASDDDVVVVPLKLIFNNTGATRRILTDSARFTVPYKAKNPSWEHEELRIHLPYRLTDKHHIMFFFSEVDVDVVRKQKRVGEASETLLGVSVLRLLEGGVLRGVGVTPNTPPVTLPVISCVEPLPRGYLTLAEQGWRLPFFWSRYVEKCYVGKWC
jgi:hypothetical protein